MLGAPGHCPGCHIVVPALLHVVFAPKSRKPVTSSTASPPLPFMRSRILRVGSPVCKFTSCGHATVDRPRLRTRNGIRLLCTHTYAVLYTRTRTPVTVLYSCLAPPTTICLILLALLLLHYYVLGIVRRQISYPSRTYVFCNVLLWFCFSECFFLARLNTRRQRVCYSWSDDFLTSIIPLFLSLPKTSCYPPVSCTTMYMRKAAATNAWQTL